MDGTEKRWGLGQAAWWWRRCCNQRAAVGLLLPRSSSGCQHLKNCPVVRCLAACRAQPRQGWSRYPYNPHPPPSASAACSNLSIELDSGAIVRASTDPDTYEGITTGQRIQVTGLLRAGAADLESAQTVTSIKVDSIRLLEPATMNKRVEANIRGKPPLAASSTADAPQTLFTAGPAA